MIRADIWPEDRVNQMCEMIADGKRLVQVARVLGVTKGAATSRFKRIRDSYGEQGR